MAVRIATPPVRQELVLAAASGSAGGLGKIGTIPATSGVLIVRLDCLGPLGTSAVDWDIAFNQGGTATFYKSMTIAQTVAMTLSSLADSETLIVNGLTFTAKDAGTTLASRYFNTGGADATADASALVTVLNDATYGVPGVTATSAAGVVTLVPTPSNPAPVIQAVTGTAAGHCAVVSSSLLGMKKDTAVTQATLADTSTWGGSLYQQYADGWPYLYVYLANTTGSAATAVVKAVKHESL